MKPDMEVVYERCCGLDVHKNTVVACAIIPGSIETKTFGTMTKNLMEMLDWLTQKGCTHVAMESTGVYWKPIYNLLEASDITTLVVNAQHIKSLAGRKTDVKDAGWIAKLLRHGLLQGSYIPNRDQRELRELIRYRRSLIQERAREVNRIQKVLEGANIKLASVVSDIMGASARNMLEAISQGVNDVTQLSQMAQKRMKNKKSEIEEALQGVVNPHQRHMLASQIRHISFLEEEIAGLDREVEERTVNLKEALELLDTIPGVGKRTAEQIIAEVGSDVSRFPTAAHLASWAGLAPGNNESAGKRKSGRTRKGNASLRVALVEAATAATKKAGTHYLSAQFRRIVVRRGKNRAIVAVAHTILVIAYHILKKRTPYEELGADYFDKRNQEAVKKQAIKKLESLGFEVEVKEQVA